MTQGVVVRVPLVWLAIAALLGAYGVLAMTAARSKSPTFDEPLHAVSAWVQVHEGDFRVDPEDPPLWKYWAAMLIPREAIDAKLKLSAGVALPEIPRGQVVQIDPRDPNRPALYYRMLAEDTYQEFAFARSVLYPSASDSAVAADPDALIQRMRGTMLVLAIALGVVIALWGWQIGGRACGVVAVVLYCFDPNFLGHGPLVKNDVPLALIGTALMFAVWRAGRRLTLWNAGAIGLLCAAAITTKFSGLMFGPIVAVLLVVRALMPQPWTTYRRTLERRREKLLASGVALLLTVVLAYAGVWAAYGFRFNATNEPSVRLSSDRLLVDAARAELGVRLGREATKMEIDQWSPGVVTQAILDLDAAKALPQAWLHGLLYTYQSALVRDSYLLGSYSRTGWWYYFPVAMLVKTPVTTLAAGTLALVVLIVNVRQRGGRAMLGNWTAACLIVPPALFLAAAMRSNLNLGLRHVLPVYPFVYLGIALAASEVWRRWRVGAKWTFVVMGMVLAVETLTAFPDFIAFFNVAAGGSRGGLNLLGDSNLDWGQDLKLLAQWQQERRRLYPDEPLYLVYFGSAEPAAYGIDSVNSRGGRDPAKARGVLAISATWLQGIYLESQPLPGIRELTARLRQMQPIDVLGGTIYLYPWPPSAAAEDGQRH